MDTDNDVHVMRARQGVGIQRVVLGMRGRVRTDKAGEMVTGTAVQHGNVDAIGTECIEKPEDTEQD